MKKLTVLVTVLILSATAVPGHCFLDYLFSGGSSRDAIDNSALGELRAWLTGNPAYQYNPWHSPGPVTGTPSGQQGMDLSGGAPPAGMQQPQQAPVAQYYPPGQYPQQPPAGYGQGYGQPYQGAPQPYQAVQQTQQAPPSYQYEYQAPPQPYQQGPPVQYSQPQGYPQAAPQYQAAPQAYPQYSQQYPAAPQGYPQAPPGQYQPAPQPYQYQYPMQPQ